MAYTQILYCTPRCIAKMLGGILRDAHQFSRLLAYVCFATKYVWYCTVVLFLSYFAGFSGRMFRIESVSVGSIPTESYVGQMFIFKCSILNIFRKQIEFAPNLPPPPLIIDQRHETQRQCAEEDRDTRHGGQRQERKGLCSYYQICAPGRQGDTKPAAGEKGIQ